MYGQNMPYGWNYVTIAHTGGCVTLDSIFIPLTDSILPIIFAPTDFTVNADSGQCGASILFLGNPDVSDNCGVASVTNDAPMFFSLGNTTVNWLVTDLNNNTASAVQTISVVDAEAPLINCPLDITINANHSACSAFVTWPDPEVTDNCSASPMFSPSQPSGSLFPLGVSTVRYIAEDSAGNSATCVFQIDVISDLFATASVSNETQSANGSIDLTVIGGTAPYSYNWTGPAGYVSGDMDLSGLMGGNYEVTISDDNGCTFSLSVIVPITLGLSVETWEPEFLIYPNPAQDLAYLQVSVADYYRVELNNSLGQKLYSVEFFGQEAELPLKELSTGIYFCKIYSLSLQKECLLKITKR
jgi:hypothetical protein